MAFDVSPASLDRTPIVRPGSARIPFEPPDRVRLGGPAADLTFAFRDLPLEDLDTKVAVEGVLCDPDPTLSTRRASTRYRPVGDFSSGARPRLLRGLFALVVLTSGQIVVIDVGRCRFCCCFYSEWPPGRRAGWSLRWRPSMRPSLPCGSSCRWRPRPPSRPAERRTGSRRSPTRPWSSGSWRQLFAGRASGVVSRP
jgi:hypothetical protein